MPREATELDTLNNHFDDLAVGDRYVSPRRTVTEADLVVFSGLSGDYSTIHTDATYADASPFGGRLAHGFLILAIASGLEFRLHGTGPAKAIAFYGMDRVRFVKPVKIGDTIHLAGEVTALDEKDEGHGIVTIATEVRNQRDEVVAVFTKRTLHTKRPAG